MDYYNNQTYYDILGVTKDASLENIRAARDRLKYGEDGLPFWKWEEIDKAYDVLSDKEKRREYDKNIDVNQFGGTYYINTPSNLETGNFDNSENNYNKNQSNGFQQQTQENLEPIENELENNQENNRPLFNLKDDNKEKESLDQPIQNGSENNSQSSLSEDEDKSNEEQSEIDETQDNLKNDIFEELKFKQNNNAGFKDFNSINKARNVTKAILGGAALASFFTPIGPLVSSVAVGGIIYQINKRVKKKVKRAKLTKESYTGIITEIQTTESRLIEESNNKLMANIDKLLQGNYNDTELQKNKLSLENQTELLEKIVENRKNTKKQKGLVTSYGLGILALKIQLHKSKRNLKNVDKNIKRDELIDSIGEENINFDSKLIKNLTIGNIYLQMKKAKLNGGKKLRCVKDSLVKKIYRQEDINQEVIEEQVRQR